MKRAVTLVEVIAGAMILAVAFAGLLATFISVRRYTNRVNKRSIATNLAVWKLNDLYRAVREDTWDSGDLTPAIYSMNDYTIDEHSYLLNSYSVSNVAGGYRRVSVTINYP